METLGRLFLKPLKQVCSTAECMKFNHKNYNFLDCDWFKKLLLSTNSLVKLLSDSLLSDK